jgi:hypothetical protein
VVIGCVEEGIELSGTGEFNVEVGSRSEKATGEGGRAGKLKSGVTGEKIMGKAVESPIDCAGRSAPLKSWARNSKARSTGTGLVDS